MSKEKPEGEVVNFHTKIHLDLTAAMAKRLGVKPDDVDEAVDEQRAINDAEPYIDEDDEVEHITDYMLDGSEDD